MEGENDNMQWFRWWHDGTTDPKLLRLSYQHRWLWVSILTLASESPKRGRLYVSEFMPCTLEDVARKASLSPSIAKAGLELMERKEFGMLTKDENGAWCVVSWEKRQPHDKTNAERQQRYRNAQGNGKRNGARNTAGNGVDTETEKETEKEISSAALNLAKNIYEWLKDKGALPAKKGWFMEQAGIAQHVLLPAHTEEEWTACLEWAKVDPVWSERLSNLAQLGEKVWPQYARRRPSPSENVAPRAETPKSEVVSELERLLAEGDANG